MSEEEEGEGDTSEDWREEGRVLESFFGVVEGVLGRANDILRVKVGNESRGRTKAANSKEFKSNFLFFRQRWLS